MVPCSGLHLRPAADPPAVAMNISTKSTVDIVDPLTGWIHRVPHQLQSTEPLFDMFIANDGQIISQLLWQCRGPSALGQFAALKQSTPQAGANQAQETHNGSERSTGGESE